MAQDTPARSPDDRQPSDVVELDEVRVTTGTHIRRVIDTESALPVTVLDFTDLEAFDSTTAVELFEYLPEAGFSDFNEGSTAGQTARGDVSAINLRGIGSGSTLVLLNGRRLPLHPAMQSNNRVPSLSVNINMLPTAIVERTEVLRDGASAVYGTDAAAGVLNTITRTDYNRTQAALRIQLPEATGGDENTLSISRGITFNDGRTYLAWAYSRFQREEIMRADRYFSSSLDLRPFAPVPWDGRVHSGDGFADYRDNDFDNLNSSHTPYGHFIVGFFNADGAFQGARPTRGIHPSTSTNRLTGGRSTYGGLAARVDTTGGFYITPQLEVDPVTGNNIGFKSSNNVPSRIAEDDFETRGQVGYYLNTNDYSHLSPRSLRHSFYSVFTHKLGAGGVELFGDLLAYHAKSTSFREPAQLESIGTPGIYVPAQNPWNPFGVRFYHPTGEPNADGTPRNTGVPRDLLFGRGNGISLMDAGMRVIDVESRSGRGVLGLRGNMFHTWQWETALNYGFAKTQDLEHNSLRESKVREALARTDNSALNPFGRTFVNVPDTQFPNNPYLIYVDQDYTNPQSVMDDLRVSWERNGRTSLFSWDIKADGDVMDAWAGTIKAATGLEYRYENYEEWRPPFHGLNPASAIAERPDLFRPDDNDIVMQSPNADAYASRDVMSAFVETLIPLVSPKQRIPLVRSLELSAALRYETFSVFGEVFAPKVSLSWRPAPWVMLRASYNESFNAPNLAHNSPDPIRRVIDGITDYQRLGFNFPDAGSRSRLVYRGSSPDLIPETAENLLFGFVIEPPFLKNFSFSLDHFRLNQKDVIDAPTGTENTRIDEDLLGLEAARQIAALTAQGISRFDAMDLLTAYRTNPDGTTTYLGSQFVNREPLNATDAEIFLNSNRNLPEDATPRLPVGPIESIVNNYRNISGRELSGFDMSARWRSDRTRMGRLDVRARATYLTRFDEVIADDGDVPIMNDQRWKNNNSKWRGNASVTWRFANMSTGLSAYYRGSSLETSAHMGSTADSPEVMFAKWDALGRPHYIVPTLLPNGNTRYYYKVSATTYYNWFFRYNVRQRQGWIQGMHFRVGIINLFDVQPSFADVARGYRGGVALARGRTFNFEVGKRF